jgi:hypothetical protein
MIEHHHSSTPQRQELPRTVKRHMAEELTGEQVEWDELLPGMANYQRDLMPWEASAETRALSELCLVLFNSNEFLYVR